MKVVKLKYYSNICYNYCNSLNQYKYETWEEYHELPDGTFEVYYKTTSRLNYCSICGQWHDEQQCQCIRKVIASKELDKIIKEFRKWVCKDSNHYSIEIVEESLSPQVESVDQEEENYKDSYIYIKEILKIIEDNNIPFQVISDIENRIGDYVIGGGKLTDVYIKQQRDYLLNLVKSNTKPIS